jgi:tetratricopeptide (TPR) repeat protein
MKKPVRRRLSRAQWLVGWLLTSLLIVLGMGYFFPVHAEEPARSQIQQGIERYHAGDLRGAIDLWNNSLSSSEQSASQIEVLKYLARAYQQVGELERSFAQFELILAHYRQAQNTVQVGRILTEQAQVLTDLGQYRQAIALLCGDAGQSCGEGAVAIAQREADLLGQTAALGSLGTVYYLQGEYEPALTALQQSRAIAEKLGDPHYLMATLNDLGNVYTSLGQRETRYLQFAQQSQDDQAVQRFRQRSKKEVQNAIVTFETSLSVAQKHQELLNEIRASIGLILPYSQQNPQKAQALLPQIQTQLKQLPDSREKAYIALAIRVAGEKKSNWAL